MKIYILEDKDVRSVYFPALFEGSILSIWV